MPVPIYISDFALRMQRSILVRHLFWHVPDVFIPVKRLRKEMRLNSAHSSFIFMRTMEAVPRSSCHLVPLDLLKLPGLHALHLFIAHEQVMGSFQRLPNGQCHGRSLPGAKP